MSKPTITDARLRPTSAGAVNLPKVTYVVTEQGVDLYSDQQFLNDIDKAKAALEAIADAARGEFKARKTRKFPE